MNIRLYALILINVICTTVSSQSLLSRVDSLERQSTFYDFSDSNTIYLTRLGSMERQFPRIGFKSIVLDQTSGLTSLDGLVDVCCFDVLVATLEKNNKLTKIRRFGRTVELDPASVNSRFTGEFTINAKFGKNDIILIGNPGAQYWGATIVAAGRVLSK